MTNAERLSLLPADAHDPTIADAWDVEIPDVIDGTQDDAQAA